uniref:Uncharacterized protein n=1 Tax=Leersia perrieri TaxID=77586 RepID=A0A0D9XUC9_9ORYZ
MESSSSEQQWWASICRRKGDFLKSSIDPAYDADSDVADANQQRVCGVWRVKRTWGSITVGDDARMMSGDGRCREVTNGNTSNIYNSYRL